MRIDDLNSRHLIADEGKVLRRLSDQWVSGTEIYLGYTYYLNDKQLVEPFWELPEHYEEVEKSELDELFETDVNVLVDLETSVMTLAEPILEQTRESTTVKLTELLVQYINKTDEMEREIAELKKMIN